MKPLVTDLWPQFWEDPTFAASFAQVLVDRVEQLRQSKQIHIYLRGPVPLCASSWPCRLLLLLRGLKSPCTACSPLDRSRRPP